MTFRVPKSISSHRFSKAIFVRNIKHRHRRNDELYIDMEGQFQAVIYSTQYSDSRWN